MERAVLRALRTGAHAPVGDDPMLADPDVHVAFAGPVTRLRAGGGRYEARVGARIFSHEVHLDDLDVEVRGATIPWITVDGVSVRVGGGGSAEEG